MALFILAGVMITASLLILQDRGGKQKDSREAKERIAQLEEDIRHLDKTEEHRRLSRELIDKQRAIIERQYRMIEELRQASKLEDAAALILADLGAIANRHDERTITVVRKHIDDFTKPYVKGFDKIKREMEPEPSIATARYFMQQTCDALKKIFEENQRDTKSNLTIATKLKRVVLDDVAETVAESVRRIKQATEEVDPDTVRLRLNAPPESAE